MHRKIFKNNRRFLLVWFIIFTCLTGCSGIGRQQDTGNESALEEIELSEDAKSETAGQRVAVVPAVQTHRELPVKSILTRREKKS